MTRVTVAAVHDEFLSLLPAVETHAGIHFRHLSATDREEAIADAVAYAFDSFRRLRWRGKDPADFPVTFSRFTARAVANGRAIGRMRSTRDVMARTAQCRRGFTVQSLDACSPDGCGWWRDVIADDRASVPDQASVNIDFAAWLSTLTASKQRTAQFLVEGHSTGETAELVGVSPGRISQLRRELASDWLTFMATPGR